MSDDALQGSMAEEGDWRDAVTWYTHETTTARLIKLLGSPLFRVQAHIDCVGLDHIPPTGPCVMAFNHISNFDAPFIISNLPRHPFFMAKQELFKNGVFGWVLRKFGGFPINRGGSDPWALQQAGRILEAGQMLFMFPEGTRNKKAQLKRGKVGAVKLALAHKAPIIPAAVLGTQHIRIGWKTNNIRIQFDEPLDVAALAGSPPYDYETYQHLTTLMMRRIAAMLPSDYRGVYR